MRLIRNESNLGLSVARNKGIQNAVGKYVYFLDGDDFLEKGSLSRIMALLRMQSKDPDMIYASCYFYYGGESIIQRKCYFGFESRPMNGSTFFQIMTKNGGFNPMVPCYFFRKDFLIENALYFCEGLIYEDMEFSPRAVLLTSTILATTIQVFNYRQRSNSLSSVSSGSRMIAAIQIAKNLEKFANF